MLKNYKMLPNGLIRQINRNIKIYDFQYVDKYNNLGEIGLQMSYLRMGFLIGALGFKPQSILDVGYGNGNFLSVASKYIDKCYGTDTAQHHLLPEGVEFIENSKIYDLEFDVVSFFDVLEHFDDIYDIKKLKTKYIAISVPNCDYKSDQWFENWKHRKPDEHLWFFNKETLITFFQEIGYECITTSYIEDIIRKDLNNKPNILNGIFKNNKNL